VIRAFDLLDNSKLVAQLVGLERRTVRSGRDSIDHGPGGHDDLANAAAGALLSASVRTERVFRGAYGYGGPVTWWDAKIGEKLDPETMQPIQRPRIRVVRLTEQEAPAVCGTVHGKLGN
jgi:hypothetical protein